MQHWRSDLFMFINGRNHGYIRNTRKDVGQPVFIITLYGSHLEEASPCCEVVRAKRQHDKDPNLSDVRIAK